MASLSSSHSLGTSKGCKKENLTSWVIPKSQTDRHSIKSCTDGKALWEGHKPLADDFPTVCAKTRLLGYETDGRYDLLESHHAGTKRRPEPDLEGEGYT